MDNVVVVMINVVWCYDIKLLIEKMWGEIINI